MYVIVIGARLKSPKRSMALTGIGLTFTRNGFDLNGFQNIWAFPVLGGWNLSIIS